MTDNTIVYNIGIILQIILGQYWSVLSPQYWRNNVYNTVPIL